MKIGIVTFFKANNYGALLQCYALSEFLKKNDHKVYLVKTDLPEKNQTLRAKIRHYFYNKIAFENFRNGYLPSIIQSTSELDVIVFGSDQIWNLDITKTHYASYFGDYVSTNAVKIAYAASFGINVWIHSDKTRHVKAMLNEFSSIGVRESEGIAICKDQFNVNAQQVLDPTLLIDKTLYDRLYEPIIRPNYIACYIFHKDTNKINLSADIARKLNCDLCLLSDMRYRKNVHSIPYPSVSRWLSFIRSSNFVITDSFHCMVFAIIFNKDFIAIPAIASRAGRMTSLLKKLSLEQRFFPDIDSALSSNELTKPIDYMSVNYKLEELKLNSHDFLVSAIKTAKDTIVSEKECV